MTAQTTPEPRCAVCGLAVAADVARCPGCGLRRPTATGPRVLTRAAMWALAAMLFVVWVTTLAVVAAAR